MDRYPVQYGSHLDSDASLGKLPLEDCCAVGTGKNGLVKGSPHFSVIIASSANSGREAMNTGTQLTMATPASRHAFA